VSKFLKKSHKNKIFYSSLIIIFLIILLNIILRSDFILNKNRNSNFDMKKLDKKIINEIIKKQND